jgi:hypothetical protein
VVFEDVFAVGAVQSTINNTISEILDITPLQQGQLYRLFVKSQTVMGFSSEMELLGRPVGPAVKPHDFTFQIMDCLWEVPVLEGEEEEIPLDGSESTSKGLNVSFERSYYNFKVNVRNQQQSVLGNFFIRYNK